MYSYELVSDKKSLCWIYNCGDVKNLKPVDRNPQAFSLTLITHLNPDEMSWMFSERSVILPPTAS